MQVAGIGAKAEVAYYKARHLSYIDDGADDEHGGDHALTKHRSSHHPCQELQLARRVGAPVR